MTTVRNMPPFLRGEIEMRIQAVLEKELPTQTAYTIMDHIQKALAPVFEDVARQQEEAERAQ